jgi:hypothetical protein
MTTEFISEDDLLTFEGWSKYQGADLATMPPDDLTLWKECFEQAKRAQETSPKVGLMRLRRVPGQEQYAVAIRNGSDLWLTLWVRCSPKGRFLFCTRAGIGVWMDTLAITRMALCTQRAMGTKALP